MNRGTRLQERPECICVSAPARLHLGFLDMNGDLGRVFGSLGLTLADIQTRLCARQAASVSVRGPSAERVRSYVQRILGEYEIDSGVHIEIDAAIPAHIGLGSGTQLGLAVSAAIARLFGLDADIGTLAALADRGLRSGIGIGAFQHGGFLVDGGRATTTTVPPVICRMRFPDAWRIVLIFDDARTGLSGRCEQFDFKNAPTMDAQVSGHLCRVLLMQVLPALVERDLTRVSTGIAAIQEVVGDYFASFQGGRYSSPRVAEVLDWFRHQGILGVGQSSWGPTGFALIESEIEADKLMQEALRCHGQERTLRFQVCGPQNVGASVRDNQRVRQVDVHAG